MQEQKVRVEHSAEREVRAFRFLCRTGGMKLALEPELGRQGNVRSFELR